MDNRIQNGNFKNLVHLYLLNEISREQFECMCQAMRTSSECRDEFRSLVRLDVGLRELSIGDSIEFSSESTKANSIIIKLTSSIAAVLLVIFSVLLCLNTFLLWRGCARTISISF